MTKDELDTVLARVRAGAQIRVSYDSPRGLRRYEIGVLSVVADAGTPKRINLERGSAAWSYIKQAKSPAGEVAWYFFQPNPCRLVDVEIVRKNRESRD